VNARASKRNIAPRFGLIGLTIALLIAPGCTTSDPSITLPTLAAELARQLVTWWLL